MTPSDLKQLDIKPLTKASYTIINGKIIVDQGQLVSMDMQNLLSRHRAMTADLMSRA